MPVRDVWVGTEPRRDAGKPGQLCQDAGFGVSQQFPFVLLDYDFRQRCECPVTPVPRACSCCILGAAGFGAASSPSAPSEEKTMALLETAQVCLYKGRLCLLVVHSYACTSQNEGSEALIEFHSHVRKVQVHTSGCLGKFCC